MDIPDIFWAVWGTYQYEISVWISRQLSYFCISIVISICISTLYPMVSSHCIHSLSTSISEWISIDVCISKISKNLWAYPQRSPYRYPSGYPYISFQDIQQISSHFIRVYPQNYPYGYLCISAVSTKSSDILCVQNTPLTRPFLQGPGSAGRPTQGSLSGEGSAQDIGHEVLHDSCPISTSVGLWHPVAQVLSCEFSPQQPTLMGPSTDPKAAMELPSDGGHPMTPSKEGQRVLCPIDAPPGGLQV